MSLKVDTKMISEEVVKIDKYIKDYNDNCYNIFLELSKLDSYWKDSNVTYFKEKIAKEKNNCMLILETLKEVNSSYKEIDMLYSNISNNGK